MAWLEAHQKLEKHPKTLALAYMMVWDLDQAIGKLLRFWWWSMDFAEDGDLRRYTMVQIAGAMGVAAELGPRLVQAMVTCGGRDDHGEYPGFLDEEPYFRIHDWWETIGPFLRIKYRHSPEKWKRVAALYGVPGLDMSKTPPPNLTLPNRPNQRRLPGLDMAGKPETPDQNVPEATGSVLRASEQGDLDPDGLLDLWNELTPSTVPKIREKTESRRRKARLRLSEHPGRAWWVEVMEKIKASKFLQGDGGRGWTVSLDFILDNDKNAVKIMEGRYDGHDKTSRISGAARAPEGKYEKFRTKDGGKMPSMP